MARYINTLTLNKDPVQVEGRIRHFLTTYGFVPSKKGNWFEQGNGFWEAKRRFAYRYENGVLVYEAWLNNGTDPSDGKYARSIMTKKAYMAELASFDQFILGNVASLPEVAYSPAGTYIGAVVTVITILLCISMQKISLYMPFASLVLTVPNGTKSKVKALAYIVIILDILLILYWLLSVTLGATIIANR